MIALISLLALAPMPQSTAQDQKMKMLDLTFLAGDWKGEGWQGREDSKESFRGEEKARFSAGSTALVIEGKQHGTVNGSANIRERYNGLVVITWNSAKSKYRITQQTSSGSYAEYEGELKDKILSWNLSAAMNLTLQVKDGEWLEEGWMTRDGQKTKIFELRMKKES